MTFERSVAERMLMNKVGLETMGLRRARTPHRRLGAQRARPSPPRARGARRGVLYFPGEASKPEGRGPP